MQRAIYLAEMIERVGLLSGNEEELAPIVWETYQDWNRNKFAETKRQKQKQREMLATIKGFRETVCRPAGKAKFPGLFDMIGCFRRWPHPKPTIWPCATPSTAQYIHQAVSIDEGWSELSPTLLQSMGESHGITDAQEIWFAGSHGVSDQPNIVAIVFSH